MKIIKCKECGEQIPSNVAFCHNCGYPIKTKRKFKNAAIRIGCCPSKSRHRKVEN